MISIQIRVREQRSNALPEAPSYPGTATILYYQEPVVLGLDDTDTHCVDGNSDAFRLNHRARRVICTKQKQV
jgi:hypothetical protein